MVDFRSSDERDTDRHKAKQEQADYKRMYDQVLAENRDLHSQLSGIEAKFGSIVAEFESLRGKFAHLETQMKERSEELFQMSETMQNMVASGYEQQTDLMERFRADISQRLTKAAEQTPKLTNSDG